jgi:hypothetical protein
MEGKWRRSFNLGDTQTHVEGMVVSWPSLFSSFFLMMVVYVCVSLFHLIFTKLGKKSVGLRKVVSSSSLQSVTMCT